MILFFTQGSAILIENHMGGGPEAILKKSNLRHLRIIMSKIYATENTISIPDCVALAAKQICIPNAFKPDNNISKY